MNYHFKCRTSNL